MQIKKQLRLVKNCYVITPFPYVNFIIAKRSEKRQAEVFILILFTMNSLIAFYF